MPELKRFENLRSVQAYIMAWEKIHKPEKLTKQTVKAWVDTGRLVAHRLGSNAHLIDGGLEVEKRPRGAKKKHENGFLDEEKYCELCDRLFDDLPKHMKRHERIAARVLRFEERKAKKGNGHV